MRLANRVRSPPASLGRRPCLGPPGLADALEGLPRGAPRARRRPASSPWRMRPRQEPRQTPGPRLAVPTANERSELRNGVERTKPSFEPRPVPQGSEANRGTVTRPPAARRKLADNPRTRTPGSTPSRTAGKRSEPRNGDEVDVSTCGQGPLRLAPAKRGRPTARLPAGAFAMTPRPVSTDPALAGVHAAPGSSLTTCRCRFTSHETPALPRIEIAGRRLQTRLLPVSRRGVDIAR